MNKDEWEDCKSTCGIHPEFPDQVFVAFYDLESTDEYLMTPNEAKKLAYELLAFASESAHNARVKEGQS